MQAWVAVFYRFIFVLILGFFLGAYIFSVYPDNPAVMKIQKVFRQGVQSTVVEGTNKNIKNKQNVVVDQIKGLYIKRIKEIDKKIND